MTKGVVRAVNDVSFFVDPGEVVCLVGESGSGKTVTCMTILGLTRGGTPVSGARSISTKWNS